VDGRGIGVQSLANGFVRRSVFEVKATGEEGTQPRAGGEQNGQQGTDGAGALAVAQTQVVHQQVRGDGLDVRGGQDRLHTTRASIREWSVLQSHSLNRSEEHTSELQSPYDLVCRLLLEKKKKSTSNQAKRWHK